MKSAKARLRSVKRQIFPRIKNELNPNLLSIGKPEHQKAKDKITQYNTEKKLVMHRKTLDEFGFGTSKPMADNVDRKR